MAYDYLPCDRDQPFLMPPSLREWLPEGHLVWFVIDTVAQVDLSAFHKRKRDDPRGAAAFQPTMLLSLLMYAYSRGVRSSRQIERLCHEDVAYRILCANLAPDHATIARFRQQHEAPMNTLFNEVLRLCNEAGIVKLGVVALDGTKVAAKASLDANRTRKHIEAEVERMLKEAAEVDAAEDALFGPDRNGDELPAELADPKTRLERLRAAKRRLDEEQARRDTEHAQHLQKRAEEEARQDRKLRGRKPKPPVVDKEAQANVTDPDSRMMKTRRGYVQGYNVQAVATREQIVIATEVTDEANDVRQLVPMMTAMAATLEAAGVSSPRVRMLLADAGYWSEENEKAIAKLPVDEALIATTKDWKRRKELREEGSPRGRIPSDMSRTERMERRLRTKRGQRMYAQRGCTIEPVFGQNKDGRGFDRFMRRGQAAVSAENKLMFAVHNMLKLFGKRRASGPSHPAAGGASHGPVTAQVIPAWA